MSVCLHEIKDPDIKANRLELWANDYGLDTFRIDDDDGLSIYMSREEAVEIANAIIDAVGRLT